MEKLMIEVALLIMLAVAGVILLKQFMEGPDNW